MKNNKKHVFIYHYPLILGHFFVFSSTNTQTGAQQTRKKGNIFTVLCAHKNTAKRTRRPGGWRQLPELCCVLNIPQTLLTVWAIRSYFTSPFASKKAHKARHMIEFRRWHGVFTPHRRKTRRQWELYPTIPAISRRKGGAQPPTKSHKWRKKRILFTF